MSDWEGSRIKIQVDSEVHRALRELKGRGETFNDVIKALVQRDVKRDVQCQK